MARTAMLRPLETKWWALALLAGTWACSDRSFRLGGGSTPTEDLTSGSAGSGTNESAGSSGSAGSSAGSISIGGTGGGGGGGGGGSLTDGGCMSGCSSEPQSAIPRQRRADLVLAVDTTSTPSEALRGVEAELNGFAQRLYNSSIDLHLVLLARQQPPGICVPAPLGSGSCEPQGADSLLPNLFHHPTAVVDDGNALKVLIEEYPAYVYQLDRFENPMLVVVTGGDATAVPWNDPAAFTQAYGQLRPLTFPQWRMSAYYAFTKCPGIRAEGRVYRDIVDRTGGVHADLCTESAAAAFERIASSIIGRLRPCEFTLPQPQPERQLDYDKINVGLRLGGTDEMFPFVGSSDRCDAARGGWYYDDPAAPTAIVLCPASCERMRSARDSELIVSIGCPTIVFPGCN